MPEFLAVLPIWDSFHTDTSIKLFYLNFGVHFFQLSSTGTAMRAELELADYIMTLRYAHLAPSHKFKAVEMLDTTLTGNPTIQKLYNSKKG